MGNCLRKMGKCFSRTFDIPITSSSEQQHPPLLHHNSFTMVISCPEMGRIVEKPMVDMSTLFLLDKELGRGQFGTTYLCIEKSTGTKYACKTILKSKLLDDRDVNDLKREILMLQHLTGQPNIVEFHGAYEDQRSVHLVMEVCSGGELFDRIIKKGSYSEKEASRICREIVNVVNVCHFMGVMHRDLKPENFLLVSNDEDAEIKATDFGLSGDRRECILRGSRGLKEELWEGDRCVECWGDSVYSTLWSSSILGKYGH